MPSRGAARSSTCRCDLSSTLLALLGYTLWVTGSLKRIAKRCPEGSTPCIYSSWAEGELEGDGQVGTRGAVYINYVLFAFFVYEDALTLILTLTA